MSITDTIFERGPWYWDAEIVVTFVELLLVVLALTLLFISMGIESVERQNEFLIWTLITMTIAYNFASYRR